MSAQSVLFDAPGPRARRNAWIANGVGILLLAGIAVVVLTRLGEKGQLDPDKWLPLFTSRSWLNFFLPGLQNTLVAALYAIVLALAFGLLFGLGRLAPLAPVRWVCGTVVEFFRAVPVLMMMIVIYLGLGFSRVVDASLVPLIAVVGGLTLYNGAVIAELVRSGVFGLPRGQKEAAYAVGMTHGQSLRVVELPQALLAMLPSLVSQFVVILKDSALGSWVTYGELLQFSRQLGTSDGNLLQTLLTAAVIFIVINYVLTRAAQYLASRISRRTAARTTAAPPAVLAGSARGTAGAA
ncbi:polar amino acid ABC transporter, inner membrane subunit [Beutenbergia cavernae DSM 12333]|uniref:Polar amino acid ABC transporter, inner membrane subunit n=1 Tax=Beutenbergia cavernae (strain ATCC BAA-8 / DSM 12333 / CCUG 43141 / JCM 11478 / NBRC 16432 / NCIMB 13614 / HKI 0122) TaxID=471853 RepID=C5BWN0_BEUC1|nr:amino acid ABC transporter permease [Beutenbergia cavernae]ACQ80696.1 polar amino acid ABC transporter, inner membrane subunit [Beutenbergia cavernae DSM 12333]